MPRMASKLTERDRRIVTGAIGVVVVFAVLLTYGYFEKQRKAAEPKPLLVDLAETAAKAARAQGAASGPEKAASR
jgi:hypothetical protein